VRLSPSFVRQRITRRTDAADGRGLNLPGLSDAVPHAHDNVPGPFIGRESERHPQTDRAGDYEDEHEY
jgi:hypothetical protein